MGEVNLIIHVGFKLVRETERIVEIYSFSGPIVVQQKQIIIVEVAFDVFGWVSLIFAPGNFVLLVRNVLASPIPACPVLLVPPLGPNTRFHSNLVQAGSFCQVENVEFDAMYFFVCVKSYILVYDFEVVPLSVALGVEIVLQPQIVLDVAYFGSLP